MCVPPGRSLPVCIFPSRPVPGRCRSAELSGALMLSFTGAIKVFVALDPQDMCKSFNGLSVVVSEHLQCDLYQGALYLFINRRHDRLKIFLWDGTGLWVASKRLEQGTFSWPKPSQKGQKRLSLTPEALSLLTDGVDLKGARMRPWYERE
jgi:transposase